MYFEAVLKKKKYQIIVEKRPSTWEVSLSEEGQESETISIPHKDFEEADNVISFLFQGKSYLIDVFGEDTEYSVFTRGSYRKVKIYNDEMLLHESLKSGKSLGGDSGLTSGMPGKIVKVMVKPGDEVKEGDPLLIMEAMKMENEMKAGQDAKIKKVLVKAGDNVEAGSSMILFDS